MEYHQRVISIIQELQFPLDERKDEYLKAIGKQIEDLGYHPDPEPLDDADLSPLPIGEELSPEETADLEAIYERLMNPCSKPLADCLTCQAGCPGERE